MHQETIRFTVQDGVARLTLDRPERLNAFTVQMHEEVAAALDVVEASPPRVLLLTGAGRGFCAGQDLADRAVAPGGEPVNLGESVELRYPPLIRRLVALPYPADRKEKNSRSPPRWERSAGPPRSIKTVELSPPTTC